jgi:hypothetical protein
MIEKNQSPFFPGRPVQPEFFIGRKKEIERTLRSIKEVECGGQKAIYLSGEYGIGKSSFAKYTKLIAEQNHNLLGIHVMVSGAETIDDISERTLKAIIESSSYKTEIKDNILASFSKYIDSIGIPGIVSLKLKEVKSKAADISLGYMPFLRQVFNSLKPKGIKGIFLIFDDLNGITKNPKFAYFIKEIIDGNALSDEPIPLFLMLCGIDERRLEMIKNFQPIDRIFDIVDLQPIEKEEVKVFFQKAFDSANYKINQEALDKLCRFSDGFPKLMHLIGDNTYWMDKDGNIDVQDADNGIIEAAEQLGKQSIDEKILSAIRSEDYHNILSKLVTEKFGLTFKKSDVSKLLSPTEVKKFNNFLQKMKTLNVLKQGNVSGEYIFRSRMEKLYMIMNSIKKLQK